jgi:hypothetical protein
MKKTLLILAALTVAQMAFSQGSIVFINRGGTGTATAPGQTLAPIYFGDTSGQLTATRISGNTSTGVPAGNTSYGSATFINAGTGGGTWTAQLWGLAGNQTQLSADEAAGAASPLQLLVNVAGQNSTTFRTAPPALFNGIVNQPSNPMIVPGAASPGANTATFQMRVWDTKGGTIATWADVLAHPDVARGYSDLFQNAFSLGGTESPANPPPYLQGLKSFNVFIVPEPSVIALGVLGAGCLFLLRRRK